MDRDSEVWIGGPEQLDIDFCILAHVAFGYVFHLAIDFPVLYFGTYFIWILTFAF